MSKDSVSGSDGFSGAFFQECWDIVKEDIILMVISFFCGSALPKFVSYTDVVLIPKKEKAITFSDLRPISLSTSVNKMISKVLHERIVVVLPNIISKNQIGFMNGRSIAKNVLLAQELIRDLRRKKKNHNVVVKLDMAKAYDKVSWIYLTKVMRKFGFNERIIDMVWRLISNNWYSIIINARSYDFFNSSTGLK